MRVEEREIKIRGKKYPAKLLFIEEKDRASLRSLFNTWKTLSAGMKNFKSRGINMPEGVSESAFALEFKVPRVVKVSGGPGSFDTFDLKNNKMQQIKATSVEKDLTSFGPKSIWDELYWLDFYRNGKLDGSFDVYKIPDKYVYKFKVNIGQTFRDQQKQKRRPRFGVRRNIINKFNLKPLKTCKI